MKINGIHLDEDKVLKGLEILQTACREGGINGTTITDAEVTEALRQATEALRQMKNLNSGYEHRNPS